MQIKLSKETQIKLEKVRRFYNSENDPIDQSVNEAVDGVYAMYENEIEQGLTFADVERQEALADTKYNPHLYEWKGGKLLLDKRGYPIVNKEVATHFKNSESINILTSDFVTDVKKSGNSMAVNIPSEDVKSLGLKEKDTIHVKISPIDKIVITKKKTRK